MRKIGCMLLLLGCCSALYALPMGNPSGASLYRNGIFWDGGYANPCDPCFNLCEAWSLRAGFYGDYVFNRHMETRSKKSIDVTKLDTSAGYLLVNFCDRLDLFSSLGGTTISFHGNGAAFGINDELRVFFSPKFSWSLGGRATLLKCYCLSLGIEGQYFRTRPDFARVVSMTDAETIHIDHDKATYREWQVGLGISYEYATCSSTIGVIPYTGVKWACSKLDMGSLVVPITGTNDLLLDGLESEKHYGIVIGTTITLREAVGVTVEGRFADEKAVHVLGEMRF